jgi:hypothetical protein
MTYTINQNVDVNAQVDIGNIQVLTNTISSTNTNGDIVLSPNGSGNVGVGTTSPLSSSNLLGLHISKSHHSALALGEPTSSTYGGIIQTSDQRHRVFIGANIYDDPTDSWTSTTANKGYSAISCLADANDWGSNIQFWVSDTNHTDGANLQVRMTIKGSGLIGVGTSSPDEKLHVAGNVSIDAYGQGDGAGIFFRDGYNSGNDPYNLSITAKDWRGGTTTSDGFVISGFHGIGFQTNSNTYSSGNIRMFVANNGIVGVGTISPSVGKIQVSGYVGGSVSSNYYTEYNGSGSIRTVNYTGSNFAYSIYCSNAIGANGIGWTSDERIKTEISVVDDAWALQKVRDIECKEYHYKDPLMRKSQKTIGYIAQDVQQHLPQAVSVISEYIPDEMRPIENITWTPTENGFKVVIPNLTFSEEHTRDLLFYVSNNEDEEEQRIELTVDEENAIIFEKQYTKVFLYGKKVNNFLQIAKDKIYSLHHSAIQEIDRRQTTDNERILELEGDLTEAQETIAILQAQVAALLQHTGVTV